MSRNLLKEKKTIDEVTTMEYLIASYMLLADEEYFVSPNSLSNIFDSKKEVIRKKISYIKKKIPGITSVPLGPVKKGYYATKETFRWFWQQWKKALPQSIFPSDNDSFNLLWNVLNDKIIKSQLRNGFGIIPFGFLQWKIKPRMFKKEEALFLPLLFLYIVIEYRREALEHWKEKREKFESFSKYTEVIGETIKDLNQYIIMILKKEDVMNFLKYVYEKEFRENIKTFFLQLFYINHGHILLILESLYSEILFSYLLNIEFLLSGVKTRKIGLEDFYTKVEEITEKTIENANKLIKGDYEILSDLLEKYTAFYIKGKSHIS